MSDPQALIPQRLAVTHPLFRYSESKNPYSSMLQGLQGRAYSCHETETFRGHWREQFPDHAEQPDARRELHVEVGCNAGHVVVEWAKRNPSAAWIGLDWKFKPIHRAAEKGLKKKLGNLLLLRAHAERLPFIFGEGEIDYLQLFFPDPWPRKKQWKNRYLTAENLRRFAPVVRPGGIFEIRTDHAGYFDWIEDAVQKTSDLWEVASLTRDKHAGHPSPEKLEIPDVTLFERLFIRDGLPIHAVSLRRRG